MNLLNPVKQPNDFFATNNFLMKSIKKSPRNRTITLSKIELDKYSKRLINLKEKASARDVLNKTIQQDLFEAADLLPGNFVDLLIIDPPYNLSRTFNTNSFKERSVDDYAAWIESFIIKLRRILKPNASIYFCGDWHTSISIPLILQKYFIIQNRITWEREKGRGARNNWKAGSEDIWYCTVSNKYTADNLSRH